MATEAGLVAAREGAGADRQVTLHPLVIINISDHITRWRAKGASGRLLGGLVGEQSGLNVAITNSFELSHEEVEGQTVIDTQHLGQRSEQYTAVFPNKELLGWYSVGAEVRPEDLTFHRAVTEFNESPLFLLMNPVVEAGAKELPISLHESELHVVNDVPTMLFVRTAFKVGTAESERIALDHVAKSSTRTEGGPTINPHLQGVDEAVLLLQQRVAKLLEFLRATKDGSVPFNHALVRQVAALCNQLPATDSDAFHRGFMTEYNDTLLVTYLATLTKSAARMTDVVDKYTAAYQDRRF